MSTTGARYSGDDDPEHPKSWYIQYSDSPVMKLWLPNYNDEETVGEGATIYYGKTEVDCLFLNARYVNEGSGIVNTHSYYIGVKVLAGSIYSGDGATYGASSVNGGSGNIGWRLWSSTPAIWHKDMIMWYITYYPKWFYGNNVCVTDRLARCIRED